MAVAAVDKHWFAVHRELHFAASATAVEFVAHVAPLFNIRGQFAGHWPFDWQRMVGGSPTLQRHFTPSQHKRKIPNQGPRQARAVVTALLVGVVVDQHFGFVRQCD